MADKKQTMLYGLLTSIASKITYDNTASGLEADNVQDAIDEVSNHYKAHIVPVTWEPSVGSPNQSKIFYDADKVSLYFQMKFASGVNDGDVFGHYDPVEYYWLNSFMATATTLGNNNTFWVLLSNGDIILRDNPIPTGGWLIGYSCIPLI